jgi:hypothetical protein
VAVTRSAADIELDLGVHGTPGYTVIPLMLAVPRDRTGRRIEGAPKTLQEALEASEADTPLGTQLEPVEQTDWSGGVGVDYQAAEGLYTRTPGWVCPAGAPTDVALPSANASVSVIHDIAEYNGDLWVAQLGDPAIAGTGRVLRSRGGTAPLENSLNLPAGDLINSLQVFEDGDGFPVLYAASANASRQHGRLHRFDSRTQAWTSSPADAYGVNRGRYRLEKVLWQTDDGVAGWRLVTISAPREISYSLPETDVFDPAAWYEGIRVQSVETLQHIIASRRHVYISAPGEVFDLDEQGNAHAITSYSSYSVLPGVSGSFDSGDSAAAIHDGWLYVRLSQGLNRINVEEQNLSELPGQCAPGWGTPAENRWSGFTTALAVDQGYVVNAVYSPTLDSTAIFWGKDRRYFGEVKTANPLIWYGPEVFTEQRLRVLKLWISGLGGGLRLWIAGVTSFGQGVLSHVSLPIAGTPLSDMLTSRTHRFATGYNPSGTYQPHCALFSMPETWRSQASVKHVYEHTLGTRGLQPGITQLTVSIRADPEPGSQVWVGGTTVDVSPVQTMAASPPVTGHKVETRIHFSSAQGLATPPKVGVLDLVRSTAWRVAPDMPVRTLEVEYGAGVLGRENGTADPRSEPDLVGAALRRAAQAPPIAIRDARGRRWTAKVLQAQTAGQTIHQEGSGMTVRAKLTLAIMDGPS